MKRREAKGAPSKDLLVCFPTRSHLTLMPKMICSPSRTSSKSDGGLWSKRNQIGSSDLSEPTSPKVTCVGQIKVRPKSRSCKNWQSVMEQIERIHKHNNIKHEKKSIWGETIGFKKESMQFLTSLRSFKFDLGCFGAFPNANVTSDDEEEDDEIHHVKNLMRFGGYNDDHDRDEHGSSRSAFLKWFRVLEENQDCGSLDEKEDIEKLKDDEAQSPCVPPSNALLLMRCRSAPVKSLSEEKEEDSDVDGDDEDKQGDSDDDEDDHSDDNNDQHGDGKKRDNLMELMKYEGDFYKLSCDIAKETWVVGGNNKDTFSRSLNSKRCSTECLEEVKACLRS